MKYLAAWFLLQHRSSCTIYHRQKKNKKKLLQNDCPSIVGSQGCSAFLNVQQLKSHHRQHEEHCSRLKYHEPPKKEDTSSFSCMTYWFISSLSPYLEFLAKLSPANQATRINWTPRTSTHQDTRPRRLCTIQPGALISSANWRPLISCSTR